MTVKELKKQETPATVATSKSICSGYTGDVDDLDNLIAIDDRIVDEDDHAGQHPALRTVCVINAQTGERIIPNTEEPAILSNECFEGKVMLLIKTPDADHALLPRHRDTVSVNQMGENQKRVSQYFKGKKRRFEFQFQIKLKKVPEGPLFLGCELAHGVKVGTLTKGLVGMLLGIIRRVNPGFHYSWGPDHDRNVSEEDLKSGNYEACHLSFPVEASMDRIVITKPGETPPTLGEELFESAESVKRRRKQGAGSVDWNLEDTYTMCLWSAYCDWIKWKSSNVPGVSPFSLCRVTGKQPIYLTVYEISSCDAAEYKKKRPPHLRKDLNVYTRLEFSNAEKTIGGLAESITGFRKEKPIYSSEQSLPDTESVDSDFETMSRISHITMN
jgi:hypothetical protein